MIRMIQSKSAGHAKAYFNDALLQSDYYLNEQELPGRFQGRIADRLGLDSKATKEAFHSLCENVNPLTGGRLTPRTIDQRTVGYDINFHCPKSVSVIHALSKDDHILKAFQASVQETMLDIETDSKTRIRKKGQYDDRQTGELVWAEFIHQTARPVDGSMPDPHLHAHCFTFNITWDEQEKLLKAGQFRDIKRDMPYYEARFHKRLADKLSEQGYQIRKTDKFFEVENVPQKVIDLFSKRTDEIGKAAKAKGITDPKRLDELGAKTRSKKQKGLSMADLKREWIKQIKESGLDENANPRIRHGTAFEHAGLSPEHCVEHAVHHRFERVSVMQDRRILETAYRHALGKSVSLDAITKAFKNDKRILHIKEAWRTVCTTKEVLAEEKHMVDLANQGKGKLKPIYLKEPTIKLKGEQHEAVRHVLTTPHRVSIIRGRAGTGKTTLMEEAATLINNAGKKVIVVAPTAQASRGVLRESGFGGAETVAKLMVDKTLQENLTNQVLWVDEAGLLGTKDMVALLELSTKKNAQLILSGDTRQHSSVIRGDALRILNTVGGIKSAEVSRIYRQTNKDYLEAVQHLSDGKVKKAFDKLNSVSAIKSIDPLKPNETLVEDYVAAIKKGKSTLIISPTHKQGEEVTDAIRQKLRALKMIGKKETTVNRLTNFNLTEAQKNDVRSYKAGDVVQFNQNFKGIKRGSAWTVKGAKDNSLEIGDEKGNMISFPVGSNNKFEVYQKSEIGLSRGDKLKITRNGFDASKKRLDNGQIFEVMSASKKGKIRVRNPISKTEYNLPSDYGHFAHAHCVTSHASQGKTVDEVFIAQPASTFPATDLKQFYVSVSRGKQKVHIYTDDKEALLDHASQIGDRKSALELFNKNYLKEAVEVQGRAPMYKDTAHDIINRMVDKPHTQTRWNYGREPEI